MASDSYYKVVRGVGLLLVLVLLGSVLINGPPSMWVLSAVTVAMTAVVILAAFMLAWTNNFQAQGRYLAPVLPMLGVYYYHARPYLWKRLADVLVLALFVLAVYSFVFVGLADIPKFNYMLK
jgi:hypothetical protein